jgi:hypothetical protein
MPPPEPSRDGPTKIDALDIDGHRSRRHVASSQASGDSSPQRLLDDNESLLSNVLEGIIARDRRQMQREITRYLSYISAVLNA